MSLSAAAASSRCRVLPEDRRAALGRDHRVDGVLQHEHAVGDADGERAAGAALADDDGDDRHGARAISSMLRAIASGLAALFGADARDTRPACR